MMERTLRSSGIINDIYSMREFAKKLLKRGKDYDELLNFLFAIEEDEDGYTNQPSMKEIQAKLKKPYSTIRKHLNEIYSDLEKHDQLGIEFPIKKVEYVFEMVYFQNRGYFTINDLPAVPRIGESVRIPFLREKIGSDWFYVESIAHYLGDTTQTVNISLKPGSPNHYLRIAKDEALLKGRITYEEYYKADDYEIREKLGLRRYLV